MKTKKKFDHAGSSFESFLDELHIRAEVEAVAIKRVIAREFLQAMKMKRLSKNKVASEMKTSRSQLDRLLDPTNFGVTLGTINKAAKVLGKRVYFMLEDEQPKRLKRRAA